VRFRCVWQRSFESAQATEYGFVALGDSNGAFSVVVGAGVFLIGHEYELSAVDVTAAAPVPVIGGVFVSGGN